ncbi:MAG: arginase family protein [Hyphomicrobiaceae bacterium]
MPKFTDAELFTPPLTFMGAPAGRPGAGARAAILGLPFDCGVHPLRVGARGGPDAVRQASQLKRRFNPTHADFDALSALGAVDCGNVRLTPGRIDDAFLRIEAAVTRITETGAIPVTIGGDGSISVPVARAMAKRHPGMVALHIDAHTDAYDVDPADRFNASTQFTHIAEEGLVDAARSWHVGIRGTTYFHGVIPKAQQLGYTVVSMDDLMRSGFAQRIEEFRQAARGRPVYLCFDMDVFDPSVAPGVATPTWGGLTAREGLDLLRCLTDLDIIAVDVNTVSPPQDTGGMAASLCVDVIYECLVLLCRQLKLVPAGA